MGTKIAVSTEDGSFFAYVAKPGVLPAPAVVVLQEAFGVNADLRATCDELAAQGFVALCPDLYWRLEPGVELSDKTDWPRALALYEALDLDQAVKDIQATVTAAKECDSCSGRVGVMGFCLGGLLTYLTAARGGVDAGVAYYGGRTNEFLDEAGRLRGPLLMHLGELDEFITPGAQAMIRTELLPRGVEIHSYPGCWHAFARHQGAHFDARAARRANGRTVDFLRAHLY
jgi:carboxymethylenebutenolidase